MRSRRHSGLTGSTHSFRNVLLINGQLDVFLLEGAGGTVRPAKHPRGIWQIGGGNADDILVPNWNVPTAEGGRLVEGLLWRKPLRVQPDAAASHCGAGLR